MDSSSRITNKPRPIQLLTIYVENTYTGAYWGINFASFSRYDRSMAEFIEENPADGVENGVYLIRFGTFEVQDAEASINDSTFQGLASWPRDDDVMIGPTTQRAERTLAGEPLQDHRAGQPGRI
jgi:hypothetical protein